MEPEARRRVRIIGILLLAAGIALVAMSFATFLRVGTEIGDGPDEEPVIDRAVTMMIYLSLGAIVGLVGVFLVRLGFLKPVAAGSGPDGDPDAWPPGAAAGGAADARFCDVCGHPERAGARHCSECGATLAGRTAAPSAR